MGMRGERGWMMDIGAMVKKRGMIGEMYL